MSHSILRPTRLGCWACNFHCHCHRPHYFGWVLSLVADGPLLTWSCLFLVGSIRFHHFADAPVGVGKMHEFTSLNYWNPLSSDILSFPWAKVVTIMMMVLSFHGYINLLMKRIIWPLVRTRCPRHSYSRDAFMGFKW